MKLAGITKLLMLFCCLLFVFSYSGCTARGPGFGVHVGGEPRPVGPPPPPPGPPPHAPAHGYHAHYGYHYYPDAEVYFDISRGLYFFLEEGNWRMSVTLPTYLHLRLGDHVTIHMDSDRPYIRHKDHKKKYPPHYKKKKKKKGKWRKW